MEDSSEDIQYILQLDRGGTRLTQSKRVENSTVKAVPCTNTPCTRLCTVVLRAFNNVVDKMIDWVRGRRCMHCFRPHSPLQPVGIM